METQLTQEQAIAQGYKYCIKQFSGEWIVKIENCDFKGRYVLCEKEPQPYRISDDTIRDLLDDYLCNQDEVYDEDGHLNDAIDKVDYSDITKKVNEALSSSIKFWHPTNILLVQSIKDATTLKPQPK